MLDVASTHAWRWSAGRKVSMRGPCGGLELMMLDYQRPRTRPPEEVLLEKTHIVLTQARL